MKLLKQVNTQVNEDAAGGATGGGAIGGFAMPLFSTLVKRTQPAPKKKKKSKPIIKSLSEYVTALRESDDLLSDEDYKALKAHVAKKHPKMKLGAIGINKDGDITYQVFGNGDEIDGVFKHVKENDMMGGQSASATPQDPNATYDTTEVFAKLKAFQNKESAEKHDTVSFGLEDDDGNIVRVSVKRDQAEPFENALNQFLGAQDEIDGSVPDIAEVLFKLKDHFDIVNVEWPEVEEDEEEDQQLNVQGEEGAEGGVDDIGAGEGGEGMEGDMAEMPPAGGDMADSEAKSLLVQVIDMMKADAEARKAEALARQKEAEVSVSKNAAREATAKVKSEEELLDMEAWEKQKKEEEKEAKKLARLARWKQETGGGGDDVEPEIEVSSKEANIDIDMPQGIPAREEEEKAQNPQKARSIPSRVKPADVASFILSRVK